MPVDPISLYDSRRFMIPGRGPCFLGGTAIPPLSFMPRAEAHNCHLTIMLPVRGESSFAASWFTAEICTECLPNFMESFLRDPEGTLEALWDEKGTQRCDPFVPELRRKQAFAGTASSLAPSPAKIELVELDI